MEALMRIIDPDQDPEREPDILRTIEMMKEIDPEKDPRIQMILEMMKGIDPERDVPLMRKRKEKNMLNDGGHVMFSFMTFTCLQTKGISFDQG